MHHSIFRDDSKPEVKRCTTCCTLFHCPLCPTFKPTVNTKLQCHLESHIKHSITFKDKKICRCNQSCRDGGHYYCPLCGKTIIRKSAMDLHLKSCTNTQDSPSTPAAVHTSNQNPITVKTATTSPAPPAPSPQASTVVSSSAVSAAQNKSTTGLKKAKCPYCKLTFYKKNISRGHTTKNERT
ncbi:unnamed protein product [Arctogadus glacialis]